MLRKNMRMTFGKGPQELTYSERWELLSIFEGVHLDLTKEQQRKGIQFLTKTHFRKDGTQRKSSKLTPEQLDVIKNFSHFLFVGLEHETFANGTGINAIPLYRTVAKDGTYFDYSVDPSWFGSKCEYYEVQEAA